MRDSPSVAVVAILAAIGCSSAPEPRPAGTPTKRYQAPDERVVFFGAGSAELRYAEAFFALGYVSALLDQNRALHVLVIGHADRRSGDGTDIEGMAWRRARAVREKLMAHGIGPDRILLGVPRAQKQELAPNMARRADVFVYDPVEDEASQRLGYEVELRKE